MCRNRPIPCYHKKMTQPKKKSASLLESIHDATTQDRANDFLLKKWRREAEKLRTVDPAIAYMALGIIEGFEGNLHDCRENFQKALRLVPNDSVTIRNYAAALSGFGLFEEAETLFRSVMASDPVGITKDIVIMKFNRGDFESSLDLIEREWKKVSPATPHSLAASATEYAAYLKDGDVDAKYLLGMNDAAFEIARTMNVFVSRVTFQIQEDEEDSWLLCELEVNADVGKVMEMELALTEKEVELDISPEQNVKLVVAYKPLR